MSRAGRCCPGLPSAARSSPEQPGPAQSCQELFRAAGSFPELLGVFLSCQELLRAARRCPKLPRAVQSCTELPRAGASCPELARVARSCSELPGAIQTCRELPPLRASDRYRFPALLQSVACLEPWYAYSIRCRPLKCILAGRPTVYISVASPRSITR